MWEILCEIFQRDHLKSVKGVDLKTAIGYFSTLGGQPTSTLPTSTPGESAKQTLNQNLASQPTLNGANESRGCSTEMMA